MVLNEQQCSIICEKENFFGIRNLLALRFQYKNKRIKSKFLSDPAVGETRDPSKTNFRYATDSVKFIREHFGDYFSYSLSKGTS